MADSLDAATGGGGASAGGSGGGTSASGGGGSGGEPGRGGCGGAIACTFDFSPLRAALGTSWEDVSSYSVRVCRNDSCADAELASLLSAPAPGSAAFLRVSPPLMDVVTMAVENNAGAFIVSSHWTVRDPTTLVDGDIYLMQVTDASGSAVVTVRKRASYQRWTVAEACSGNLLCGNATLVDAPEEDAGTAMLPADAMPPADATPD